MTSSPEYSAWANMKYRCGNPKCKEYRNYGARGISVCSEWLDSFDTFLEDMGRRPGQEYSLERKDNSAGYFKGNCSWADKREQANNRRTNRAIGSHGNESRVALALSLSPGSVTKRIKNGWGVESAASTINIHSEKVINGVSRTLLEWSRLTGINFKTLHSRIIRGDVGSRILRPVDVRKRNKRAVFVGVSI